MISDGRRDVIDVRQLFVALGERSAIIKSTGVRAAADEENLFAGEKNAALQWLDEQHWLHDILLRRVGEQQITPP